MTTKITPNSIAKLAAGDRLQDTETVGLYVEANRDGTRSWRYLRRLAKEHGGKVVKATLGTTRDYTIPDARDWAATLNARVSRGHDPVADAKAAFAVEKAAERRALMTVNVAAAYYLETIEAKGEHQGKTLSMKRSRLKDILPAIGHKPLDQVTHEDLQGIVEAKNDAGLPSASNHLVADIKTMFRWFTRQGRSHTGLKIDPSVDVHRLNKNTKRSRVFSMKELRLFIRTVAECDDFSRRFLTLLLLSGQRFENVMTANRDHWCPDVDAWEIERTKNGEPNVVPLGSWGRSFFAGEGYVFPSPKTDGSRSTNSGSIAMKARAKMNRLAKTELERWTLHDLRRVVSTHMARLRIKKEVVEAVLAHTEGGVAAIYNRWQYLPEKTEALAAWEAEIIRLAVEEGVAEKLGIPSASVTPINTSLAA